MSDKVRDHYETYPYPARDPDDEKERLITGSPSHLLEIDHYLFRGQRDFSKPFRALVAGGGTGDATIMLAQQLADAGSKGCVTYLDLSEAAKEVTAARAKARGLTNISYISGSLLDLPRHGGKPYDYIDCCGVLHHLEDPLAGLVALKSVLADDGGMGLMVYGALGRRGVYEVQSLLRRLTVGEDLSAQVKTARRLLASLPPSNWLRRNPVLGDHKRSDAELADLLLHPCDRAYRVGDLARLIDDASLNLVRFIEPARYDPASYIKDPKLLAALSGFDPLERAAMAEELAGNIKTHICYVSGRAGETTAGPSGSASIPCLRSLDGPALARACARNLTLKAEFDGLPLSFTLPRLAPHILSRIDNRTALEDIFGQLQALDSSLTWEIFAAQFQRLFAVLSGLNHLLLKQPA